MSIIEVMHMAPLKQHMYQHLRSAKEWLTKAEEAFDKEHNVRAELDLMLAQAELQHVKEANRSGQWRYKYVMLRHGVALTLAIVMTISIGGMYWWANKPVPLAPAVMAGQVNLPVETMAKFQVQSIPVQNLRETTGAGPIQEIVKPAVNPETRKAEEVREPVRDRRQPEATVVVSADEMQKMVRAAGKSLRGQ